MLDNLGIIVKTEDAYKAYAKQIGKTANALTDAEKKQAFMNAALVAAEEKVSRLGDAVPVSIFDQLSASVDDLGVSIGESFALEGVAAWANFAVQSLDSFLHQINLIDTSLEKATSKITDERIATQMLKNELAKTSVGTQEYYDVKEKIIARFPKYFSNLSDEEIKIGQLNKALDDHNNYLMEQIKVEIIRANIADMKDDLILATKLYTNSLMNEAKEQLAVGEAADKTKTKMEKIVDFLTLGWAEDIDTSTFYEIFDKMEESFLTGSKEPLQAILPYFAKTSEEGLKVVDLLTMKMGIKQKVLMEILDKIFEKYEGKFDPLEPDPEDLSGDALLKLQNEIDLLELKNQYSGDELFIQEELMKLKQQGIVLSEVKDENDKSELDSLLDLLEAKKDLIEAEKLQLAWANKLEGAMMQGIDNNARFAEAFGDMLAQMLKEMIAKAAIFTFLNILISKKACSKNSSIISFSVLFN